MAAAENGECDRWNQQGRANSPEAAPSGVWLPGCSWGELYVLMFRGNRLVACGEVVIRSHEFLLFVSVPVWFLPDYS